MDGIVIAQIFGSIRILSMEIFRIFSVLFDETI
jgi:hypothetical protein